MEILAQFLLRLAFGLAVGMAITSSQQVSSGFFRNHLYVTMGLATLAALVMYHSEPHVAWFAAAAALASYIGSVCWLYEAHWPGRAMLWLVALASLLGAWVELSASREVVLTGTPPAEVTVLDLKPTGSLQKFTVVTSSLVLGLTLAAMLLGHWYLNAPGMELAPLRRLIGSAALSIAVQMTVSGIRLAGVISGGAEVSMNQLIFIVLRWSFGLLGVLALLWMAWRTLEIPNTQSATGVLYVAVIGVFVGELTAALLSAESVFPL